MENTPKHRPLAVITGASSGIGYELAKIFAKNGYDLIVAAEDKGLIDAANAFRALGSMVETVQTDLSTYDGVDVLAKKINEFSDRGIELDSICLNAGFGVSGEFVDTDLHQEIKLINLNIISLVHLTKHVLPRFVNRGHGRILFTSSLAATMPGPWYACYAASKAFVQSFAEAIRVETKDTGVTITALQPGATDTNFFERADMMDTKAGQGKKDDPADVAMDGFNALMAGRDHVVAGSMMNNVQAVMAKVMPQSQTAKMQGSSVKPGSGLDKNT